MSIKENETIARRFEEAANTGNTADAAEFIAPGFTQYGPGTPPLPSGPEGFQELIRFYRAVFPDLHLTIEDMLVTEDKAAIRYRVRGTHRGEFEGIPPTGKQVETMGIDIVHITDGKITKAWTLYDTLGFLQQIGAVRLAPVAQATR